MKPTGSIYILFFFIPLIFSNNLFADDLSSLKCTRLFSKSFDGNPVVLNLNNELTLQLKAIKPELYKLENYLLKNYHPKDHILIFIGRSLSIPSAYLKARHPNYVYNMPLSKFRPIIKTSTGLTVNEDVQGVGVREFDADDVLNLYHHYDMFIPNFKNKNIVLIDYATSGSGLIGNYYYLQHYLKQSHRMNRIIVFGVIDPDKGGITQIHLMNGLFRLNYFQHEKYFSTYSSKDLTLNHLISQNDGSEIDFSEFGTFDLHKKPIQTQFKPSEIYQQIIDFYQRNLDEDHSI